MRTKAPKTNAHVSAAYFARASGLTSSSLLLRRFDPVLRPGGASLPTPHSQLNVGFDALIYVLGGVLT